MIWKLFRRSPELPPLMDPVFGRLLFTPTPWDPSLAVWEGRGAFAPLGRDVEYHVSAGAEGPGEEQRALYRRMEARYPEISAAVAEILSFNHRELLGWELPADLWSVYSLGFLTVPRREAPDMEWELTYDSTMDANHVYTIEVEGWRPLSGVCMDG